MSVPKIIQVKPTALTKLTQILRSSSSYSGVVAKSVITIPTTQMAAVLVTFNSDLVRASNILVMLTPPKLYTAIVNMPEITKKISRPDEKTSRR